MVLSAPWRLAGLCRVVTVGLGAVPFELWPLQRDVLELCLAYREVVVLKARQLGVSWALALLVLWDCLAFETGLTLVVSIGEGESKAFLEKVKVLWLSLPGWVRGQFRVAVSSTEEWGVRHAGGGVSKCLAISSSATAGRSLTARRVVADERAWWAFSGERMTSLRPAFADGGSLVEVSTANGFDTFRDRYLFGRVVPARPVSSGLVVPVGQDEPVRLFVPADARPGRSREWIRVERAKADRENPGKGAQEYPLSDMEAFVASGSCDFDAEALQWYLDVFCRPAPWRGVLRLDGEVYRAFRADAGQWEVWAKPRRGAKYLVSGDFSGGGGAADATALAVYDAWSWEQVAAFHGRPNPDQAAREMMKAGYVWRSEDGPSLLVPEANNHGQAVVAHLVDAGYPRVYEPEKFDVERGGSRAGRTHGWLMNGKSKQTAVSALQEGVRDRLLGIRDRAAIGEMLTFYGQEALDGKHDDRVITHAIAAAVLKFSRSAKLPTGVPSSGRYWTPADPVAGY